MSRWMVRACATLALVSVTAGMAVAGPQTKPAAPAPPAKPAAPAPTTKTTKPTNPKCPVCGMFMASKPTKASTVAVQLKKGGPTYYCCPKCKMPADVLVKPSGKKEGKM